MATISTPNFCNRCHNETLPDHPQTHCAYCGYSFERPSSKHFSSPKYLFYQMEAHKAKLSPNRKGVKPPTKEELDLLTEIEKDHKQWLIQMHADDRIAALTDALMALRYITASKTFGEELKRVIDLGKRVGELASSIEGYIKHGGGLLHARELGQVPPDGRDDRSSAATAR